MTDANRTEGLIPFAPGYRASGVLVHITSLPSPYGIGDVGPAAFALVDRLQAAGQRWWQALPLGPTGYGNSPYQCLSSFAGNGLIISPDSLVDEGLLRKSDCDEGRSFRQSAVDYDVVIPFKHKLLEKAWTTFRAAPRPALSLDYDQFCIEQAHWLDDYALFRALKIRHGGASYLEWPEELIRREPAALAEARRNLTELIEKVRFAQFLLFRQGKRLREHALAKGVHLIGDLPFFVSPDSSDVWANPELFLLDEQHRPRFVAGVPPDYFSAQGQLWGNPVYNWEALRQTGYRWCIDRLRALLTHVDVVRLDHFRGFAAAWHVPAGAQTAQSGQWVPGPDADFFSAVQRELGTLPFIAEDLGLITPDVYALRDQLQLPGMRILQFAFDGKADNPYLPHNYVPNTVVYTGTHDNDTTRAWFEGLPEDQRRNMWNYLQRPAGKSDEVAWELVRLAWSSAAGLAIAPLQDLLNLGAEARMPGSVEGNWSWRCTDEMLSDSLVVRLRDLNRSSHRSSSTMEETNRMRIGIAGDHDGFLQSKIGVMDTTISSGRSYPLGATVSPGGVSFSVFAKGNTAVQLLLFDHADDAYPSRTIALDSVANRSGHYWHVFVPGIENGQIYGYRVDGSFAPEQGLRFDPQKVLLDPYGRAIARPPNYSRVAAATSGDNCATAMKSVVADVSPYDWEGDEPLRRPFSSTVIYEMHVAGFTKHPSSGLDPAKRGTYAGLIGKIPYLQDLGVTAVELQPVFQFDEQDAPAGLTNYWGYSPVSFFTPHSGYSSRGDPLAVLDEFRDMVRALHRAGIEVILDVVYNHTAEGDNAGPTLCFKGFANQCYYILDRGTGTYANFTGTGNTLNANEPFVRRLIRDSLHYWVDVMHVDGFRFDLASILSRDESGRPLENPPILWDIDSDPALADTKLIAEAWDAAGLYQVGSFIGDSWKEWNGRFRDDVRSFMKSDNGTVKRIPYRLFGSPDIYGPAQREPEQSINFVACHDGFTLNDLVSYIAKHNEANGENNRDGAGANLSWNCGVEGPSDDPAIEALRNRMVKNFLVATLLSVGTPMLLMGDEVRRTQRGNNNGYCQDNEISWFDWSLLEKHPDIHRFVKTLIEIRHQRKETLLRNLTLNQFLTRARIECHGIRQYQPDWSDQSHSLAIAASAVAVGLEIYLMLNAYWEPLTFELPPAPKDESRPWRRWLDTFLAAPDDICAFSNAPLVRASSYLVNPRSIVALARIAEAHPVTSKTEFDSQN
jgi:isoamylase